MPLETTLPFSLDLVSSVDALAIQKYILDRRSGTTVRRERMMEPEHSGTVVAVDVSGILVRDAEWSDELSTRKLAALFNTLAANEDVSAAVLKIDSPGGTVAGMADLMDSALALAAAKPLIAYVDGYCCSAAYELACAAEKIYAGKQTTIGSIGTRIILYDYSKLFEEHGIEAVAIDTGSFKSLGAMGLEITEQHRVFLQKLVNQAQADFESVVQTSRGLTGKSYEAVSDGKVFWAAEALGLGLIDGVQSLAETFLTAEAHVAQSVANRSLKMANEKTVSAATLAELKEAMPESTADFRETQIEAGATLNEAITAHCKQLLAENQVLKEAKAEAEAEAEKKAEAEAKANAKAEAEASTKKRGNTAVSIGDQSGDTEATVGGYHAQFDTYLKTGKTRKQAASLMARRHPELTAALVAAAN